MNELARRIGVNASTASRLLATLEQAAASSSGHAGGPYRLGLQLVALSDRVLARLDVRERARPWLAALVERDGGDRDAVGAGRAARRSPSTSCPSPFERGQHGAAGTAERASRDRRRQGDARVRAIARAVAGGRRLLAPTPSARSPTPSALVARARARCGTRGIAEAIGEREPDLAAMAAPVLGRRRRARRDPRTAGAGERLPAAKRRSLERPLRRAAAEVGRRSAGPALGLAPGVGAVRDRVQVAGLRSARSGTGAAGRSARRPGPARSRGRPRSSCSRGLSRRRRTRSGACSRTPGSCRR